MAAQKLISRLKTAFFSGDSLVLKRLMNGGQFGKRTSDKHNWLTTSKLESNMLIANIKIG